MEKHKNIRKIGCCVMIMTLLCSMCGCSFSVHRDKDSEKAYEIATDIVTAIGKNDKTALEGFFSENSREKMNTEDFDALASNYSFSIRKIDDWFINTSQSDTEGRYRITAGFYIEDDNNNEYEIEFQYYVTDNDDKKIGLSAIAFSSKKYFEENDRSLSLDYVILVPSKDEEQ